MIIGARKMEEFLRLLPQGETPLSLTQEIGIVILGSCASGQGNLHYEGIGLSTVEGESTLNLKFWHHYLDGVSGSVLILTECCGQYANSRLEQLRREFPKVTFVAPEIRDYCDNFGSRLDEVREDLLRAGIIRIG